VLIFNPELGLEVGGNWETITSKLNPVLRCPRFFHRIKTMIFFPQIFGKDQHLQTVGNLLSDFPVPSGTDESETETIGDLPRVATRVPVQKPENFFGVNILKEYTGTGAITC
jgi:hypothetical protein